MSSNDPVQSYLDLLDSQREEIFALLAGISIEELWRRPAAREWSIGEILNHTTILNRSFRRIFQLVWFVSAPLARRRRGRPYQAEIDDVYARPGFPMEVGWLWRPRHKAGDGVTPAQLYEEAAVEHNKIRRWYEGRDTAVLGHLNLYDPVIGWLNLVQALRVGVYHDALHYRDIAAMINQPAGQEIGGRR